MLKKNSKILLYGGKSTALIVNEMLNDIGIKPKYIFDEYIKKISFKTKATFSNKKKDLNKFIEKSNSFFVLSTNKSKCLQLFAAKKLTRLKQLDISSLKKCI